TFGTYFFSIAPLAMVSAHISRICREAVGCSLNHSWTSPRGLPIESAKEDIVGTIPEMFQKSISFFTRNLHHIQAGQSFNSTGLLEISPVVLEELLQNALTHRDYSKNAPIRICIFDNRVEIISPGKLPNSLTVENIKRGNAVVRNNLIVSYSTKLMRYRGFGSGIVRALKEQPDISFINDVDGEQFTVIIPRKQQ
ncbi:MAG: hypothetical protein IIU33_04940, partial [Bacteroidales bacterium]|nr:hypothetical protein [Bacteroidales bacterium]